ncbi:hypothetical protein, partial [Pseudomonas aeruginosa]|uniref:hypothetical protein n=1 Tax=Pseudomonas aeruginosa TaxID=287 RepID=UPI00116C0D33
QYKHYEADVPERYETTQVKRENGQIVFDSEGKPVIEHKAGDITKEVTQKAFPIGFVMDKGEPGYVGNVHVGVICLVPVVEP